MAEDRDWIERLWRDVRPSAAAKVVVILQAAERLRAGGLDPTLRYAAWQEAHRLAGSLGSYGHDEGAEAAAEAEALLEGDGDIDPDRLRTVADQLRTATSA